MALISDTMRHRVNMSKLLTIGMSVYDDFDGVYFSIQSLRMHHPICRTNEVEFVIIDNNPDSQRGKATGDFCKKWLTDDQYIPYTLKKSTAVRNEIFRNARGKYSISMDCHVLFMPGAIDALLDFYSKNPDCQDLVQGPLMYDGLGGSLTHFRPIWGEQMYGRWGTDNQGLASGKAFDIPMQGLGVFSCETKNWRGFSKLFKGFGGEEGYIHEKFRQYGGRTLCLPDFKWVHRFARPDGVKYPLNIEDRIWNYLIGWHELEDQAMIDKIIEVFSKRIGAKRVMELNALAIERLNV
jgi:hypothetical protein